MIDNFKKVFGPNPPRYAARVEYADFRENEGDEEHRRQVARVKNKRRFLGLAAILLGVAVVAPAVFEPNDMYADRGAKLEVPALQDDTAAKVVPLNREKPQQTPPAPASIASQKPAAADSLTAANPVNSGAKPMTTPETRTTDVTSVPNEKTKQAKAMADKKKPALVATQTKLRSTAGGRYFIQVVATSNRAAAEKLAGELRDLGLPCYTEIVRRRGSDLWRVRVGRFAALDDAKVALDILAHNSIVNGGINQQAADTKAKP